MEDCDGSTNFKAARIELLTMNLQDYLQILCKSLGNSARYSKFKQKIRETWLLLSLLYYYFLDVSRAQT